jgi:hypothetical protein
VSYAPLAILNKSQSHLLRFEEEFIFRFGEGFNLRKAGRIYGYVKPGAFSDDRKRFTRPGLVLADILIIELALQTKS